MRLRSVMGLTVLALSYAMFLPASTVYDEAVQGDLSNSGLNPTRITVTLGSNQIFGTTGYGASGIDRDYFTITVPTGLQLSSLMELAGTTTGGEAGVSFLGMQAGNQVTVSPNPASAAGLLGWTHYGRTATNRDLLPVMSSPNFGSSGFTRPLGAGDYSFWIQDYDSGRFSYGFDLVLAPAASPAPEPGSYTTMLAGFAALAFLDKRRRNH